MHFTIIQSSVPTTSGVPTLAVTSYPLQKNLSPRNSALYIITNNNAPNTTPIEANTVVELIQSPDQFKKLINEAETMSATSKKRAKIDNNILQQAIRLKFVESQINAEKKQWELKVTENCTDAQIKEYLTALAEKDAVFTRKKDGDYTLAVSGTKQILESSSTARTTGVGGKLNSILGLFSLSLDKLMPARSLRRGLLFNNSAYVHELENEGKLQGRIQKHIDRKHKLKSIVIDCDEKQLATILLMAQRTSEALQKPQHAAKTFSFGKERSKKVIAAHDTLDQQIQELEDKVKDKELTDKHKPTVKLLKEIVTLPSYEDRPHGFKLRVETLCKHLNIPFQNTNGPLPAPQAAVTARVIQPQRAPAPAPAR